MLFVDESVMQEISLEQFEQRAVRKGVAQQLFQRFLQILVSDRTAYGIGIEKAIKLLATCNDESPSVRLEAIQRVSKLKFPGTDGMRGKVSIQPLSPTGSLLAYQENGLITPVFYYLVVRAFLDLLEEQTSVESTQCAVAEDGREIGSSHPLLRATIAAIDDAGWSANYLGVLPTPGAAIYSMSRQQPVLMITASHNPSSNNGLKCFVDGCKLYPQGVLGEYALTERIIRFAWSVQEGFSCQTAFIPSVDTQARSMLTNLVVDQCSEQDLVLLRNCAVTIDCANGAVSGWYDELCTRMGLHPFVLHTTMGQNTINAGCGAAVLEGIHQIRCTGPFPSLLAQSMVERCSAEHRMQYGIAVDGDGDRCVLLVLEPGDQSIRVLHGDELLTLLKQRFPHIRDLALTIESDPNTKVQLEKRYPDAVVHIRGVGDRYLTRDLEHTLVLGAEDSGHVVFPIRLGNRVLYSGNGLLTGLLAILAYQANPLNLFVRRGIRKIVVRSVDRRYWFEGSLLHQQSKAMIERLFPCSDTERVVFPEDHDMLAYTIGDGQLLYMRSSGTEPNMQLVFPDSSDERFERLAQEFSQACAPYRIEK
ncbi:hypothetical protein [Sphaerochaeta sp.]|uniref:hypothetical protein n=1 Tax=Sphaerochaeta sp. TaxID=1972642 RepID=UPI002FC66BD3